METNMRIIYYLVLISLLSEIFPQSMEEIRKDTSLCTSNTNTNTCSDVKLSSGVYQCCKVTTTTFYSSLTLCSIQVTPISTFKKLMEDKSTKALYKEISGYVLYGYLNLNSVNQEYYRVKMNYECKDGTAQYLFGYDTFTNDEIKVFQGENHCMKYFYYNELFTSKDDCFNSEITQASKNSGLSCGYIEYNIKYSDGTSDNFKSCNLFSKALIDYGKTDDKTKENFQSFVETNKDGDKIVISYTVDFSDQSGNQVVYDSLSQTISVNGHNGSVILSISKYLILIIGLLFL